MNTKRVLAASAMAAAVFATAGIQAGITGTPHDFSGRGWNARNDLCGVCHTPHNADPSQPVLWNHVVTSASFTPYASGGSMDSTPGAPAGVSILCLSCHDGTVAVEDFGGTTGGSDFISGNENLGTDLSNDHPISIQYDTALAFADTELFDPATAASGLGGTIASDLLFGALNDQMECASCHDVHDDTFSPFLVTSNYPGSTLCLTCHDK